MKTLAGWTRRMLFGIPAGATSAGRRGFRGGDARVRERLETVGRVFVHGYHTALDVPVPDRLPERLDEVAAEDRGWAYEGAAMALALLDELVPWSRSRLVTFARGPGADHVYMVYVGAGWALARLRRRPDRARRRYDPILGWLALDGYGFHEGYFHWPRYEGGEGPPARLRGYARQAFDQGLGRSLWFVGGADAAWIAETVASVDPARRADLWGGVGLACAYAGGAERETVEALSSLAGPFRPHLAQGAAFAAKARARAGGAAAHTAMAVEILCGCSDRRAAAITDEALSGLRENGTAPAYEVWRSRIRDAFTAAEAVA